MTDGEFWELWKRVISKQYKDPHGIPMLTARDLIRPTGSRFFASDAKKWSRMIVGRAVYVWTPDKRVIRYIPGHEPGDLSASPLKPWNSSVSGVAPLYAPGEWWLSTPILPGDTEGDAIEFVYTDAALGVSGADAASIAGEAAAIQFDAPASGTATNISSLVIPARPGRKYLSINTIQTTTNLRLAFGGGSDVAKGDFVPKGGRYVLTANPGEVLDSRGIFIRREDDIAGALALSWQEGG